MPSFYDRPILNSPYEEPRLYHALDDDGQPLDVPPIDGRRASKYLVPVPPARRGKNKRPEQAELELNPDAYDPVPIINEIRSELAAWRRIPNPNDWGVRHPTQRLLRHWREHDFHDIRPFFCQVEAVETAIWLTEVAPRHPRYRKFWQHVEGANAEANPGLMRLALKMATGAGKTTVMAMLMAWQTINAVRSPGSQFTKAFLIVTPGITIRDRLRVLQPHDPDSYYKTREIVPADMVPDMNHARIVITNYQAMQTKSVLDVNKVGKGIMEGWREEPIRRDETPSQMIRRVAGDLLGEKRVVVINDEAHHCYKERPGESDEAKLDADERAEARKQNEYARLWINGIEALGKQLGTVYDLSATPFFLRGSGYREGTLFPWTVSDFSLMDAIECGIVKLPRIPVSDSIAEAEVPVFRELWRHISADMPKRGRGRAASEPNPQELPVKLQTALNALYADYVKVDEKWKAAGIGVPPVFIVVCNNTSSSKLVAEWISGWERPNEDGEPAWVHSGHLPLFRNFDENGNRLAHPNTLLIDSVQIESGEIDKAFRDAMGSQIEQFKSEKRERDGAASADKISDAELLREVMNTVGKKGRLGEHVRCVVSVSMLTEGWDVNTVTHILGVRAFGTQLLCEQVVGRGLRRYNYQLNDQGLFRPEYSNILGIPFDFTRSSVPGETQPPPPMTRVEAVKEREDLEIRFPRVAGYRTELSEERLEAEFTEASVLTLDAGIIGPGETRVQGIVGEGITISAAEAKEKRPSTVAFDLARYMLYRHFTDEDGEPKLHLFGQLKSICRRWLDGGFLRLGPGMGKWMLEYLPVAEMASERIYSAIIHAQRGEDRVKAVLDPYNPTGSTRFVGFNTVKPVYQTDPAKCHVNYVVEDSDWEAEFARIVEDTPRVLRYVKNQAMQFEVPYNDGNVYRRYVPDFIVVIDDGRDDPLHLVGEVKGFRGENAIQKAATMNDKWVPGVNALGSYGRWAFHEFRDVLDMKAELAALIDEAVAANEREMA